MNYIKDLYSFLETLGRNNTREWFREHKSTYESLRDQWLTDIQRLIDNMSTWDTSMRALTAKSCVYRIYRDTRFSQDKTPLKTYFSAAFSPYGKSTHRAAYYLEMGPREQSGLYGGLWCPDSAMLKKIRRAIVDNIEEFEEIIHNHNLETLYPGWIGDMLKTVPKGYDRNHPQAELLRLKDYGRFNECDMDFFADPDWPIIASERFSVLKPLIDFLNYSLDEEI